MEKPSAKRPPLPPSLPLSSPTPMPSRIPEAEGVQLAGKSVSQAPVTASGSGKTQPSQPCKEHSRRLVSALPPCSGSLQLPVSGEQ